ncbi:MAG: FMN-binding protein [Candidatus Latescibacteria bacterium]|nr:FMN-binding protein [Candidatus Latescibacterota bacterium]
MKIPLQVAIGGKLAIICTVAAIVLGLVNAITAPVIVENRARALAEGLAVVAGQSGVPGAQVGEGSPITDSTSVRTAYPITGTDGEAIGHILQLVGIGYGGDMLLLAGYYPTGELFSAQMMENLETPGLGKKAEAPEYMGMFIGFGAESAVPTSRRDLPSDQVDSITGATITFNGVAVALADGSDLAKELEAPLTGGQSD